MIKIGRLSLVLAFAMGLTVVSMGCSRGGSYKIVKDETISGQRLVMVMLDGQPTDEKLKEWGKEISDQHGTAQPTTIMFYVGENKVRATYGGGMLVSMPDGGVALPGGPTK